MPLAASTGMDSKAELIAAVALRVFESVGIAADPGSAQPVNRRAAIISGDALTRAPGHHIGGAQRATDQTG
jgi:hypothetical protein